MNIWHYQRKLSRRLLSWSVLSFVAGWGLLLDTNRTMRAAGIQFVAWGAIDAAIALFGKASADRKLNAATPASGEEARLETRRLRRLLWINAGLDILYVAAGRAMIDRGDSEEVPWTGHGWGVAIQGTFLLIFDIVHALLTPSARVPGADAQPTQSL